MNNSREILTTKHKALAINLRPDFYGTIAEIGGGQEVSRAFFQAGGASGTIAKSISAYDKKFSNFLYGQGVNRYVSVERLRQMLDSEFNEVRQILNEDKGRNTKFFAFANTVEILNYQKTNIAHGWIGIKYQLLPKNEPNEIIIHINLLENDALLQQYTLGTLGVNLIYAAIYYPDRTNLFLQSLMENLDSDRVAINLAEMKGPQLDFVDNRLLTLQLVKNGMTRAAMFDKKGHVLQPYDKLYNKDVIILRGSFHPITVVGFDMIRAGYNMLRLNAEINPDNVVILCEMTMSNLMTNGEFDEHDFLDRVNLLNAMGQNVLITNFKEFYPLVHYLNSYVKINKLRLIMGSPIFQKVMSEKYYENLQGGILEATGKLFKRNVRLYIYPALQDTEVSNSELLTSKNISINPQLIKLFEYLHENRMIIDMEIKNKKILTIASHKVLKLIKENNIEWETMVPEEEAQYIKENKLFDYKY